MMQANIGNNIGANHGEWLLTGVWCMVDRLIKMMHRGYYSRQDYLA